MSSIDQRIVDMQFNNGEFEKGIKESMKSLEELKKALELDKQTQSLNNLEKAVGSMNFQQLSDNVEKLSHRFSTLGIVGMTALQNIANKVTDTVAATAKSLAFGSILEGKGKYEMKLESVQAIKAATGQSIEEIEAVFDKLTTYTDWTSYNFANMAQTIGQFVSKGIDLDVAEAAMEGIGNAAADAGASIQNANVAMYNFAQAIAAGRMTHMDWISINKTAHMGTKKFEEVVIDTAIELGKLQKVEDHVGKTTKGTVVDFLSFDSTLKEGWYDTDVIIESLLKFADTSTELGYEARKAAEVTYTLSYAMATIKDTISSGWMSSFQLIFGNLDEASDLFSAFTDMIVDNIAGIAEWRNGILGTWKDLGGRNYFFEGLLNIMQTLFDIVRAVGMAFRTIFPENFGETLANMSIGFYNFSEEFRNTFGFIDALESSPATSVFSTIAEGSTAAEQALTTLVGGFKKLDELAGNISYGMRGEDVKKMQQWLIEAGYSLDRHGADGIYGPETQAALKAFQKDAGLVVDGIFGPQSFSAMQDLLGGFEEAEEGAEGAAEKAWFFSRGLKNIRNVAEGVFSVFRVGWKVFTFGFKAVTKVLGVLAPIGRMLLSIGSVVGQIISSFEQLIDNSGIFELALAGLDMILAPVLNLLNSLADAFDKLLNDGFVKFQNGMGTAIDLVIGFLASLDYQGIGTTVLTIVSGALTAVGTAILFVVGAVKSAGGLVSGWFEDLKKTVTNLIPDSVIEKLNGLGFIVETINSIRTGKGLTKVLSKAVAKSQNLKDTLQETVTFDSVKDDVSWIQQTLVDAGYTAKDFVVDGVDGPKTRAAIRNFQEKMGITADGIFGPETFAALQENLSGNNLDSLIGGVTGAVDLLKEKIQGVIDTFGGDFSPANVYNTIKGWVKQIWQGFKDAVGEFFFGKKPKDGVTSTSLFTAVAPDDKTLTDTVHDWVISKLHLIGGILKDAFSSVGEIGLSVFGSVSEWFGQIWGGIIDTISELIFGKNESNETTVEYDKFGNRKVQLAGGIIGNDTAFIGDVTGLNSDDNSLRKRVKEWLSNKLKVIGESIANVLATAKEKILGLIPEKWKNIFRSIYSALFEGQYDKKNKDISGMIPFLDTLIGLHKFIEEKVKPTVTSIVNFLTNTAEVLWDAIWTFIDPESGTNNKRWGNSNHTKFDEKGNPVYDIWDRLAGFKWIWNKIKAAVSSLLGVGLKWIGDKLKWVFTQGLSIIGSLAGIFLVYNIGKVTRSLSGLLDGFNSKFESIPTKLLKIAGAFALFAAAIWVLSTISWDDYKKVAVVISVAIGIAKLIAWLFEGSDFSLDVENISKSIQRLGSGIWSLVKAIAILTILFAAVGWFMSDAKRATMFQEGAKVVGIMAAGLVGFVFVLSGISKLFATDKTHVNMDRMGKGVWNMVKSLALLVALAAAIGWYLSDEARKASFTEGVWWLAGFAGGLAVFILALSAINKYLTSGDLGSAKNTDKVSKQLITAVGAIVVLAIVAAALGKINKTRLWRGVGAVVVLAAVVGGLTAVLAYCGKKAGNGGVKGATGMLLPLIGAVAAIVIVAKTVEGLMKYDSDKILAASVLIAAIGVAVALLAKPVESLGRLSLGQIAKGAIAVVAIGSAISAVMGVAIGVLSSVAGFAADSISTAIWDVTSTLQEAAGFIADVDFSEDGKLRQAVKFMKDFSSALVKISGSETDYNIVSSFSGMLFRLNSDIAAVYKALPENVTELYPIFENTIGKISDLITNFGSDEGISAAEAASERIRSLAGSFNLFYTALHKLNGGNTEIPEVPDSGSGGTSIGTAIADAFSEIAENLPDNEDLAALAEISENSGSEKGKNLSLFAEGISTLELALSSWNDLSGKIDKEKIDQSIDVIKEFKKVEDHLNATDSIWPWAKRNSTALGEFSSNIGALGTAIGTFADSIGGGVGGFVRLAQVQWGVSIIEEIAGLQDSLEPAGDFIEWANGSKAMATTKLAKNLGHLGSGLAEFNRHVAGVSWAPSSTEAALGVLTQLGNVYSNLPKLGGLNALLFGEQKITVFADNMDELAKGLVRFNYILQMGSQLENGETTGAFKASEEMDQATAFIGELVNAINVVTKSLDGEPLAKIGLDLEKMAIHFMNAFTILNGGTVEGVATGLGESFVSDKIQNTFGLIDELIGLEGRMEPDKVGSFLTQIGNDIYNFYDQITNDVDTTDGNTILDAISTMLSAANEIMVGGHDPSITLGKNIMGNIANGMYYKSEEIMPTRMSNIITFLSTAMYDNLDSIMAIGRELIAAIALGAWDNKSTFATTLHNAIQEAIDGDGIANEHLYTITPVLDTSHLQGPQSLLTTLNPNVSVSGPQVTNTVSVVKDNSDVVRAIGSLDRRISTLTSSVVNSISGMRVVLDSGALVGQIVDQVNAAMGRLLATNSRYGNSTRTGGGRTYGDMDTPI